MTESNTTSKARSHWVLAECLRRSERGEKVDFEEACRQHPELASDLRALEAGLPALLHLASELDAAATLSDRLRKQFGEGVDPAIDLSAADHRADFALSSELLERLREQGPRGTRYQMRGEVARGGMGAVLKVWDDDLRRTLAMKVVLGKSGAPSGETPVVDPEKLGRFLEEAQITGQLDHPGIVPVHELGLGSDGRVYFTMRLVKGDDLRAIFDFVREGRDGWNTTRALGVLLRVCEAMSYAHAKGVIHRDLKPSNVMVGKFGEVYVMDWGLARVLGQADKHDLRLAPRALRDENAVDTERRERRAETRGSPLMTRDGDIVGTPAYMPPEQAQGKINELGPWSDVYSVGAMLYHLLSGEIPFVPAGTQVPPRAILARLCNGPPLPLFELAQDAPAELIAICDKAMAREPNQRYADMHALAEDLRAYLERRVVTAYETGVWAETKKWVQRNKPLAASLAAVVVAATTGGVGFAVKADQATRAAELATREAARADAKSRESEQNAEMARLNEQTAKDQEQLATQKANDVLSLSAIQDLKELKDRADALWPSYPEMVPQYEEWLLDARILIEGSVPDPIRGIKAEPSLKQHEAKLAELRQRAKARTAEQIEADQLACPNYDDWQKSRAKLTWMQRMLGEEPWPSEVDVEAKLANEALPTDARSLSELAWMLLAPEPTTAAFGNEIKALVIARRALQAAQPESRWGPRVAVSWALYRCNRREEARAEEKRALEEAGGTLNPDMTAWTKLVRAQIAPWLEEDARDARHEARGELAAHVSALEQQMSERRTFDFEDARDRWWHTQLSALVSDLKAFADERNGLMSEQIDAPHGWGVKKRLAFARSIEQRSVAGIDAGSRWLTATKYISASPNYGGMRLIPQIGLLPIGHDPRSELYEFVHLQSGVPPERGADGKLQLTNETGLVFVLIPSCSFWMGAQSEDATGHNYDPQARKTEFPVCQLELEPYFLSKYEMTQGQWTRLTGANPSDHGPHNYSSDWNRDGKPWTDLLPVEQVNWSECATILQRAGLLLPTEAQWEYACRAGSAGAYWSGDAGTTLHDVANVADEYARAHGGGGWPVIHEAWDDGNTTTAEIGLYRANSFGLHDVHGNVWEWCRDLFARYAIPPRPADGERVTTFSRDRVARGGNFFGPASEARSANRYRNRADGQSRGLGVRPARVVMR